MIEQFVTLVDERSIKLLNKGIKLTPKSKAYTYASIHKRAKVQRIFFFFPIIKPTRLILAVEFSV